MRVYLSGCISGLPKRGYLLHFYQVEQILSGAGHEVVNPASIGCLLPSDFTHSDYMDIDLAILAKCDAICMLHGWELSEGAKQEYVFAKQNGIAILYEEDFQTDRDKALRDHVKDLVKEITDEYGDTDGIKQRYVLQMIRRHLGDE